MIQRCGRFSSISKRAEQADRNTDVPVRPSFITRPSRCSFRIGDNSSRPALLCYGRTSAKSGMLNVRADQKGDAAANTASGRSSRPRLCLTARRPILAIAVLDRSWRGRYPSQRPPSRRKRTSPPRKLGGGCRRGGRVAEGGGLLNHGVTLCSPRQNLNKIAHFLTLRLCHCAAAVPLFVPPPTPPSRPAAPRR